MSQTMSNICKSKVPDTTVQDGTIRQVEHFPKVVFSSRVLGRTDQFPYLSTVWCFDVPSLYNHQDPPFPHSTLSCTGAESPKPRASTASGAAGAGQWWEAGWYQLLHNIEDDVVMDPKWSSCLHTNLQIMSNLVISSHLGSDVKCLSLSLSFTPSSLYILNHFDALWVILVLTCVGAYNSLYNRIDGLPLVVMVTAPDEGRTKRLTTLSSRAFTAFQNFRSVSQKLSSFQTSCMYSQATQNCVCSTANGTSS